ncbi:hypothetical protein [Sphaerisporangium album]|nr:hypothetical protein [Sphaerisporangium album]
MQDGRQTLTRRPVAEAPVSRTVEEGGDVMTRRWTRHVDVRG